MTLVALSLGSNVDAPKNVLDAITALRSKFGVLAISTIYESEAIGFSGDNFLNFVVSAETSYSLKDVFDYLKDLENDMGRNRTKPRYSDRTIDIDILLFGDSTGEECGLDLPRAEILYNAFILRPLAELHPQLKHTVLGVSYKNLWNAFDNKHQKLWPIKVRL
tara:strand:+ start:61 stop:549 length:489 start_codon:yes stop_codon:yes gene_type:complete